MEPSRVPPESERVSDEHVKRYLYSYSAVFVQCLRVVSYKKEDLTAKSDIAKLGFRKKGGISMTGSQLLATVKEVKKAWELFVTSNSETALERVRPEIRASWLRARQVGIDPTVKQFPTVLSPEELNQRCEQNAHLLEAGQEIVTSLFQILNTKTSLVGIMDGDAILLRTYGSYKEDKQAHINGFPGIGAQEHRVGTTAPALSLYLNRPVQVYWFEHYAEFLHCLTGCATPIHNACGQSVGTLVVSGYQEVAHSQALEVTTAAAHALEEKLKALEERDLLEVLRTFNRYQLKFPDSPILALCPHGHVLGLSHAMAKIVTLQPPDRLLGQHVHDVQDFQLAELFPSPPSDAAESYETSILLSHTGKVGTGTVVPVLSKYGHRAGLIVIASGLGAPSSKQASKHPWRATHTLRDLVGCGPAFSRARWLAEKAAQHDWPVLLVGESGTGKSFFAQSIHLASRQAPAPFVSLNCGVIPKELLASELFGYEEGTFSGALRGGKAGKIALAHEGTLFLDELEDTPLETQLSLLQFLEEGYIVPLGGARPQRVWVRVIAATKMEPAAAVAQGKLRLDLYYRLNVFPITLPPLRGRREDIPLLVGHLLKREGFAEVEVHPNAMTILQHHSWPGNIRELRNVLVRAATLADTRIITPDDLPPDLLTLQPLSSSLTEDREQIQQALQECNGNVSRAAKQLGIHRSTLHHKLREYGLTSREGKRKQ